MDNAKIDELKSKLRAALAAPWAVGPTMAEEGEAPETVITAMDGKAGVAVAINFPNIPRLRMANAEYIVALVNAAPELIEAAERAASNPASPAKVDFEQNEITAAFDAHHEFYEFPSEALRGGALNEWTWGWWAGARAERAKSAAVPASPAPVAAITELQTALRLGLEAAQEVLALRQHSLPRYTDEEISEADAAVSTIRAALAAAAPQAQAEPGLVRYCPACGSIGDVEASYRDCCPDGSMARHVPKAFAEHCRATFRIAIGHDAPVVVEAPAAPIVQPVADVRALLDADELAALRRFNETCEDGEGYDVPKHVMKRLAEIGVVRRTGGAWHEITDVGLFVLSAAPTPASSTADAKDAELWTCTGKGGEYSIVGTAKGAGTSRINADLIIYRDVEDGTLYFRNEEDFSRRMERIDRAAIASSADEVKP